MSVSAAQRRAVIQRAKGCCEYCLLAQTDEITTFHIDHIKPLKHRGTDELDNLCLSCYQCNAFKGANIAAADPLTGEATFLFNPRMQHWNEHFEINHDTSIRGKTPEGRATIDVMRINDESRIQYRQFAKEIGEYPCKADI